MKYTINSLIIFLLQFFILDYCLLIRANSDFEILPNEAADWELFDPNEYVKTSVELDIPLRYEIKPTPVALGMARSEFYNHRDDDYLLVNKFDIKPDNAMPDMEMTSFHHFIEKRQDQGGNEEGSGAECSTLSQPSNGQMSTNCQTQTAGCVLTFSCNEGYTLDGPSQLTCSEDGAWSPSNNPPECRQNSCPVLSSPQNGAISYPCRFAGCSVQYSCNTGYRLNGNSGVLTCQSNGQWNGNPPTCVIVDCGNPNIKAATYTGSTTYGSTITITCNANYVLQGSNQATCRADGTWSNKPNCAYDCGVPTVPNASFSYTCTIEDCTTSVTCNSGFTQDGNTQMTCYETQGWLYPPYCNPDSTGSNPVDVSITLQVFSEEEQAYVTQNIEQTLEQYYADTMQGNNHYADVVILTITFLPSNTLRRKKRQLLSEPRLMQVNYTVVVLNDEASYGEFSTAQANLVRNQTLTIAGRKVPVNRTSLFGFTYIRNDSLDLLGLQKIACQIFEYNINGCPAGTECRTHEGDDTTRCEPIDDGISDTEDDFALKVGLGVGIPLFLLLCALLGCCCYWIVLARRRKRKRKRKRQYIREVESSSSATMSGFSPARIPLAFDTVGRRGPLYGSQFPEFWDGSESVVETAYGESHRPRRRDSYPYVVSVGQEEHREPYTSNFSWDFMYPHVDDDFSLPRPRL